MTFSSDPYALALVFTGHMIDLPDRKQPRFPADKEKPAARFIAQAVSAARQRNPGPSIGIAGAARGGDILFHEACRLLGMETHVVLPFPPMYFIKTSIIGNPGGRWEARFASLWNTTPESHRLVLLEKEDEAGYALCNERMLEMAQGLGRAIELIALWDGKVGDGAGGTADFVEDVRRRGGRAEIIDTNSL